MELQRDSHTKYKILPDWAVTKAIGILTFACFIGFIL